MTRTEFSSQLGKNAVIAFLPICMSTLSGCQKTNMSREFPNNANFTLEVSSGEFAINGGLLVKNGIIIARSNTGVFIAVSACTHEGTTIQYNSTDNSFQCPRHGATFNLTGQVASEPAFKSLIEFRTLLRGNLLKILSYV